MSRSGICPLFAANRLTADPGRNGGVTIKGWLANQVLVRAKIETWGDTDSDAAWLASRLHNESSSFRDRV